MAKEGPGGTVTVDFSVVAQAIIISVISVGGGWTVKSIIDLQQSMQRIEVMQQQLMQDRSDQAVRIRQLELSEARHEGDGRQ